jgi:hypothetical protein
MINGAPVSVVDYGVTGSGVDESARLQAALSAAGSGVDLNGLTISISSGVNVSYTTPKLIKNGTIKYIGAATEFAIKVSTTSSLELDSVTFDGNALASKCCFVEAKSNNAVLNVFRCVFLNGKQIDTLGLAAGLFAYPDTGFVFSNVTVIDCKAWDILSVHTTAPVSRGLFLQDAAVINISSCDIRRISPSNDGDGVFVVESAANISNALIQDSYFEDCHKRSIKSQVRNTLVSNVVCRRTTPIAQTTGGQIEIDIQYGGVIDGAKMFYVDGAAPNEAIVSGGVLSGPENGAVVRNIDVVCIDPTNVISALVQFSNNTDNAYKNFVAENIRTNAVIQNAIYLYGGVGNASSSVYVFDDVVIRNLTAAGFNSATSTALVFITRGATNYVKAKMRMYGCRVGSDSLKAFSYLDPTPGTTSFLAVDIVEISECLGFNQDGNVGFDTQRKIYTTSKTVTEGGVETLTISLDTFLGVAKALVTYNQNNDTLASKLYTEGYCFKGTTQAYYVETLAGNKSNTGSGSISVAASGTNIVVTKTAGSNSANGRLQIILIHSNAVDFI